MAQRRTVGGPMAKGRWKMGRKDPLYASQGDLVLVAIWSSIGSERFRWSDVKPLVEEFGLGGVVGGILSGLTKLGHIASLDPRAVPGEFVYVLTAKGHRWAEATADTLRQVEFRDGVSMPFLDAAI